jgi:hypothetical protein
LPFAVVKGTVETVIAFVADLNAGVPEFLGVGLVSNVFEHPGDLSVLDLEKELPTELKILALLIDRE